MKTVWDSWHTVNGAWWLRINGKRNPFDCIIEIFYKFPIEWWYILVCTVEFVRIYSLLFISANDASFACNINRKLNAMNFNSNAPNHWQPPFTPFCKCVDMVCGRNCPIRINCLPLRIPSIEFVEYFSVLCEATSTITVKYSPINMHQLTSKWKYLCFIPSFVLSHAI